MNTVKGGLLARWDPLWKVPALFLWLLVSVTLTRPLSQAMALAAVLVCAALSGIPFNVWVRRLVGALVPAALLVFLAVLSRNPGFGLVLAVRVVTAVTLATVLVLTTPPGAVGGVLIRGGMPRALADMGTLAGRYIRVLGQDFLTMVRAASLRRGGPPGLREAGLLSGTLLVRAEAQAERVYGAMKTRGYGSGTPRPLHHGGSAWSGLPGALAVVLLSGALLALEHHP